jgi:hypothetical protein
MILGAPESGVLPGDPLMIETPDQRTGTQPRTMEPLVPSSSNDPQANSINGHEQDVTKRDDLQYACIFPLDTPKDCTMAGSSGACDCTQDDIDANRNRPLCQPPAGGAGSTTQYYAKAYPGVRELQTLKDFGDNGIVASICPKVTQSADPTTDPNYGYNPAVAAIISRLKEALTGKCLPRTLVPETNPDLPTYGQVPCAVIEAAFSADGTCPSCDSIAGRKDPNPEIRPAVLQNLSQTGQCGGASGQDCSSLCLCEIEQLTGAELNDCQNTEIPGNITGYCYVDEAQGIGNPELLAKCPATQRRILRFVDPNSNTPQKGAVTFIACIGASLGSAPTSTSTGAAGAAP